MASIRVFCITSVGNDPGGFVGELQMLFRQLIHEDLGCASYLVGDVDAGVGAVIDPQWEIEPYLRLSRLHGLRIEHVLETHNHADHVSGHGRLARATGATIRIHRLAGAEYPHEAFGDGFRLALGSVEIEAIHTPGHRPEHTAFLLHDTERGEPVALLSGDSLFVGDVARPDLAVEPREGAAALYESLYERVLRLPATVEVFPGHLGGSLCGSSDIDHRSSSTIGSERAHNRAAGFDRVEDFVAETVSTLGERPPNAERVVDLNRGPLLEQLGTPAPLSPRAVEVAIAEGAILIDVRTNDRFDEAHVPGAISASADDTGFATKVAQVVSSDVELIVIAASDGRELEAAELLASVGIRVRGFLEGGMTAWRSEGRPVGRVEKLDPDGLADELADGRELLVLDVRDGEEFEDFHIPGSVHIPYRELGDRLGELPGDRQIAAVCSGGKRSGLAASILKREGFGVVHVADGGVGTWRRHGRPVEGGSV